MVDAEDQVDLRIEEVDGLFVVVGDCGVETIVRLPKRYAAKVEPFVIEGGLPADEDHDAGGGGEVEEESSGGSAGSIMISLCSPLSVAYDRHRVSHHPEAR